MAEVEFSAIQQTDVVRPEFMSWLPQQTVQRLRNNVGSSGRVGIPRIPDNSQDGVLRKRATRPGLFPNPLKEPLMGNLMLAVL